MKKSEHPQDIIITDYEDVVECCCRFKNRKIGVIFIKETKVFQTYVKAYFGKENIDSNFGIISNNRGVKLVNYSLSLESLTCLTLIQTELLNYLHNETKII